MKVIKKITYITSLILFLNSCAKDDKLANLDESNLDKNEIFARSSSNTTDYLEFEQAFNVKQSSISKDTLDWFNPLKYDIDISSALYTQYFGAPSIICNTLNSPFQYTKLVRNQILILKNSDNSFNIYNLFYIANNQYYNDKGFEPRMVNFTGKVIQSTKLNEFNNLFLFSDGDVTSTGGDFQAREIIPDDTFDNGGCCCGAQCGGKNCGPCNGSGSGGTPGISIPGGSYNSPGWNGGWGDHSGAGEGGNNNSEGGSGGPGGTNGEVPSTEIDCKNPNAFWTKYDSAVKKNYINALSQIISTYNIVACHDPFAPGNQDCTITYSEILCNAEDSNCFPPDNNSIPSENDFMDCLMTVLTPLDNPPVLLPCETAIDNFNISYGFDFTPFELYLIIGDFEESCGDQQSFNEEVSQKLAEKMNECLEYDFVGCFETPNGICPESFKFQNTGDGYTCEVNSINFKYLGAYTNNINIGTLCIQTSKRDDSGNLITSYEASELMTSAWDSAKSVTNTEFAAVNHNMTNQEFKNLFIENLYIAMNVYFQNTNGISISISSGPCIGNIPKSRPKYSILCF